MGHESTDTKDTQDTTKSPQHTQQAHEFAAGTRADCMLASSCSPGRLCPLCLCVWESVNHRSARWQHYPQWQQSQQPC